MDPRKRQTFAAPRQSRGNSHSGLAKSASASALTTTIIRAQYPQSWHDISPPADRRLPRLALRDRVGTGDSARNRRVKFGKPRFPLLDKLDTFAQHVVCRVIAAGRDKFAHEVFEPAAKFSMN